MNRALAIPSLSPVWETSPHAWRWRLALLVGCAAAGTSATFFPILPAVILLAPIALLLALYVPEGLFVLFLTAGVYKADPRLESLVPVDVTVLLGVWLALSMLLRGIRKDIRVPGPVWLLAPLVVTMAVGVLRAPVPYGAEKAAQFCTLTMLALVASIVLLEDRKRLRRFFVSISVVAILLSIYAASAPETTSEGRLTLQGSSPISLGRVASLALAFGWLHFHFHRRAFDRLVAVGILAISCYCVLAAGSRGPLLSFLLGLGVVSVICHRAHGMSPMSIRVVLLIVVCATLIVLLGFIPSLPLYRFQLLFSEQKGASILLRGFLFMTAWQLMLTHPFGLGVGGFARHAILDLRYPHNLFLEVGSELGWIPLLGLLVLIVWSLKCVAEVLRREYSWTAQFMAIVVLTALLNSMVTGDLNGNRMLFAFLVLPFLYRNIQRREAHNGLVAHRHPWNDLLPVRQAMDRVRAPGFLAALGRP